MRNKLLLLMMRLRVPANRKLDGTVRFIAITTGLFFVFYRKRQKFARVETTTSVIPHDLVLEHKERYDFPLDGDWKKKKSVKQGGIAISSR